jgi:hypothetical protein
MSQIKMLDCQKRSVVFTLVISSRCIIQHVVTCSCFCR